MLTAVKLHRLKKGLRLYELAERVDITPSYLCQVENGRMRPSLELLERIAQALDVHPAVLASDPAGEDSQDALVHHVRQARPLEAAIDWALGILETPESPAAAYVRGAALGAGLVGLLWALVELGKRVAA